MSLAVLRCCLYVYAFTPPPPAGEAKIEDLAARGREELKQQANQQRGDARRQQPTPSAAPQTTAAGSDEKVDETGVNPQDIELVTSQAGCSRAAAVKALRNNDNDLVNAIMELTM